MILALSKLKVAPSSPMRQLGVLAVPIANPKLTHGAANGMENSVAGAFLNRPRLVESEAPHSSVLEYLCD